MLSKCCEDFFSGSQCIIQNFANSKLALHCQDLISDSQYIIHNFAKSDLALPRLYRKFPELESSWQSLN